MKKILSRLGSLGLAMVMVLSILGTGIVPADAAPDGNWIDYAAEAFAGGSGTADDPYRIATAEQLAKLAKDVNSAVLGSTHEGEYFVLTDSISLSKHAWTPIGRGPVGDPPSDFAFSGYFDGAGHTITGLYVDTTSTGYYAGLFGCIVAISDEPSVKGLTITGAEVSGTSQAGILVGSLGRTSSGTPVIKDCSVQGTVQGTKEKVGGLIGNANYAVISGCSTDVDVSAQGVAGGFIGNSFSSNFTDCASDGTVSGGYSVGGFAGILFYNTTVERCTSKADVDAYDWNVGGFVGYAESNDPSAPVTIKNSEAYGDVHSSLTTAEIRTGGFVGNIWDGSVEINDSSAHGTVTAESTDYVPGGFVGRNNGQISGCTFNSTNNSALPAVGGAVGFGSNPDGITSVPEGGQQPDEDKSSHEYGDYYGNEKWDDVKREISRLIEEGKKGETIEVSATGLPYFPSSVARALKGHDITLEVRKNGVTYKINGLEIGDIDKIWYEFEDLEAQLLTASAAESTEEAENTADSVDKTNPETGR